MAAIITQTGNEKLDPKQYTGKDLNLIGEFPIKSQFTPTTDTIEYYVYDINNRLISYTPEFNRFTIIQDDPSMGQSTNTISLNVEQNLTQKGYTQGTYQTVYNFFRNKLNSSFRERFFIKEISPTRTEIRLSSNNLDNSTLDILVSDFITERNNAEYFEDFFINFGENNQFVANNIILDDANPSKYTILIKLYNPLPNNFTLNDTCWICTEVADPKTFLIEFEKEEIVTDNRLFLQGPNFNIEVKDEISNATNYQTLNDLLNNTELTSSYNQLQNVLDQKGVSVNIDYGLDTVTFENFTHFSSAEQRVRNFYYKVGLIEEANNNISLIDGLSGTPDVSSSLSAYEQVITDTVKSFDGFESFMYYKSSSEGTNGTPWPKSNSTPPYTLQSTGSSDVLTWYNRMLTSASAYDQENSDNLIYSIPEYLRDDPVNAPYELFIEMMGQYFDQLYFYAEDITNKYNADNRLDFGISKDIVADVLKSFGIKLYSNNFTSDDLYAALLGINASGSLLPPTGSEVIENYITASSDVIPLNDVNKETYKRIYHNMPYLLKKKGTVEGVRALISLFGIPDTVLRISEFGGKDKDNTNDWDYTQNVFNYGTFISSSISESGIISASWSINTKWGASSNRPETVLFKFKPSNILPTGEEYSMVTHMKYNAFLGLTLAYTGSGYSSASYSGSIPSASNQIATLALKEGNSTITQVSASFYDGNWWSVQISRNAGGAPQNYTLRVANQIYNGKDGFKIGYTTSSIVNSSAIYWVNATQLYLPASGGYSPIISGETHTRLTGSYQELRYYNEVLDEATFHDFVMNPYSIEGIDYSSSANNLVFRAPLGSDLKTNTGDLTSIHPKVTGSNITNSFSSDSEYHVGSDVTFTSNTEFIYQDQPAVGIKNRISDKVKFIAADTASGDTLTPYTSIRQYYPQSESYTRDVNYVEVAFSPQNEINDDINSSFGYFNIGEYIGDPGYVSESATSYTSLDKLRDTYFEKYYKNYNWTDYIRLIKYFDNSLFKMIKDFVPAKSSLASGVVIKQHLLERNRQRPAQVEYSYQDEYSGSIKSQQYWENLEETSIMSSSLIENVEGGSATGRIPSSLVGLISGALSATGSIANQANLHTSPYTSFVPLYSGSETINFGAFEIDNNGWISMSLDSITTDLETQDILFKDVIFEFIHKIGIRLTGPTVISQIVSSSIRGGLSDTVLTYNGYEAGNLPANNFTEFSSAFRNITMVRGECFQIVTAFLGNSGEALWSGYFAPDSDSSIVGVRKNNSSFSTFFTSSAINSLYKRSDLAGSGNTILLPSQLGVGGLNDGRNLYNQVFQLPNPDAYATTIDTVGGTTTFTVNDTRQLYNGEWEGTSFVANDQILSQTQYEGSNVEFVFSTDYTGSSPDPDWKDYGFASGGYVYIDTNIGNRISISPSGSDTSQGQRGIGKILAPLYGMRITKDTIAFYIPTSPDKGSTIDVFDLDEFESLAGVTHFVLHESSSFYINEGDIQYTASIEEIVNNFNPGDRFSLQITSDFVGYTGPSEQYKVANIELGSQKVYRAQSDTYLFSIANPREVYDALSGTWRALVSHSIHKWADGEFGNEFFSAGDDFYHPGQNLAQVGFKLIKQTPVSKNTAFPTSDNFNDNRSNKFYYKADYETGLLIPTNQSAIQNKTATFAQTPQSNYTISGISNSRYKGTKVTSPAVNKLK